MGGRGRATQSYEGLEKGQQPDADGVWRVDGRVVIPGSLRRVGATTKAPWVQPGDMPDVLAVRVALGEACGSRLTKGVGYCRRNPVEGQEDKCLPHRCKLHGGKTEKPAKGSSRASKHGIYQDLVKVPESRNYTRFRDGEPLDEEIAFLRIRLRRIVVAEIEQGERLDSDDRVEVRRALRTLQVERKYVSTPEGNTVEERRLRRAPDFSKLLDQCVRQIARLVAAREMCHDTGQVGDSERARRAREAMRDADLGAIEGSVE